MDTSAFEYFHFVATHGSIARAATELGMEPSTLTRHIGRLESDMGARLFHRNGRGMVPTEIGAQLLGEVARLMDSVNNTKRLAAQLVAGGPANISLMAQPTIAQTCFGAIGGALKSRFPRASVRMEEAYGHEIVAKLQKGDVDIALLYVPVHHQDLAHDVLFEERLHCVMPGRWTLGTDDIDAEAVLELPLILPSTAHGLRGLVTAWSTRYGKPLKVPLECDGSTCMARRLVQAGLGCTVLPLASVQEDVAAGRLRSVPIRGPEALRAVAVATSKNRPPLPGLWDVMQVARAEIARLVNAGGWPGVDRMSS